MLLAARDPVLAQLAVAAVAGLPPAGPAERKREPVAIATDGGLEIVGELVVQDTGFNLHAKTRAGALDDDARARLLRYVLRPPLAQERLAVLPDHRVRLTLSNPAQDANGRCAWDPALPFVSLTNPGISFYPNVDGIFNANQLDFDDVAWMTTHVAGALTQ